MLIVIAAAFKEYWNTAPNWRLCETDRSRSTPLVFDVLGLTCYQLKDCTNEPEIDKGFVHTNQARGFGRHQLRPPSGLASNQFVELIQ